MPAVFSISDGETDSQKKDEKKGHFLMQNKV